MKNRQFNHPTIPPWGIIALGVSLLAFAAVWAFAQGASINTSNRLHVSAQTTGSSDWYHLRGQYVVKIYGDFAGGATATLEYRQFDGSVAPVDIPDLVDVIADSAAVVLLAGDYDFRLTVAGGTSPAVNLDAGRYAP